MNAGKVVRINGPIVRAEGLGGSGLYDVVEIGEKRLIGEIIRLEGDIATIQVYEDNTGMRVGERAVSMERPLSVHLGPGLLGQIYDGIQRPLREIKKTSGGYITPGIKIDPIDTTRKWRFTPPGDGWCRSGSRYDPGHGAGDADRPPESARATGHEEVHDRLDRSRGRLRRRPARRAPRRWHRVCHGALVARAPRPARTRRSSRWTNRSSRASA